MRGKSQTDTAVTYIHDQPASFQSQLLQKLMAILGKKHAMEKAFNTNKFSSNPAQLPRSWQSFFTTGVGEVNQRKVWTFKPKQTNPSQVILYIHGGGYISNLTKYDWLFVRELLVKTNCTVVVPDYPLVPHSNYKHVYEFFDKLYTGLVADTPPEKIIFMGNSAGGGIALGFAQQLRDEKRSPPSRIILNSPWLDITMSNPGIIDIDKKDKLLGIPGLKMAGQAYANGLDARDSRVSPIYGDCSGLGEISLFIGTHDIFLADARKFKKKMEEQDNPINYFEYPKMFHLWVALTSLKESKHAIHQMATLIKAGK